MMVFPGNKAESAFLLNCRGIMCGRDSGWENRGTSASEGSVLRNGGSQYHVKKGAGYT